MTIKTKQIISRRVYDILSEKGSACTNWSLENITSFLSLHKRKASNDVEVQLPISNNNFEFSKLMSNIEKFPTDNIIYSAVINSSAKMPHIAFKVNNEHYINDVIENVIKPLEIDDRNKIINVIDFGSPNIAKPFHVGHLRSTIIGNFISNLKMHLHQKVIKLNYLGDWGTQFGYLKLGVDLLKITEEQMEQKPIQSLYKAYVYANKLSLTDPSVSLGARNVFKELENGTFKDIEKWNGFRKYTVAELEKVYKRIGITYDEYHWESMYSAKDITKTLELLSVNNLLETESDGKKVAQIGSRRVPIVKSDGTTLYLTRDIAAAIDRYDRYNFDNMIYVVDHSQSDHFDALFSIINKLQMPWAERCKHVKFGRINGMSTRKGEVVFLNDILDEAKEIMQKKQLESPTTKVPITNMGDFTADILGISAVIVNDLKQRKHKNYDFNWDKVLQVQGDTGVKFQYTHCRLYSLENNSGAVLPEICNSKLLMEPAALDLVHEIAIFADILNKTHEELEACILVNYLFSLCNTISRALKVLQVKNQGEVGDQRLLLFHCARQVLLQGMYILGLQPLNEM